MSTFLIWLAGVLTVACLLASRVAFVAWRAVGWEYERRRDPLALGETLKDLVCHAERKGDLHGLAEARDAMARGFEAAEDAIAAKVPGYKPSQFILTCTLRRLCEDEVMGSDVRAKIREDRAC